MSTVLTSTLLRRRETKTKRGIPTIFRARFDGGIAHVSAVDTGLPAGSTPWGLRCEAGGSQPGAGPTIRCPTLSDSCPGGPAVPTQHRLRPAPARVGLLHEDGDPLVEGCAYCTKAPPTRSTPNPPPVVPAPRAVRPRPHPSGCEQPSPHRQHSAQRPLDPVSSHHSSVMRRHNTPRSGGDSGRGHPPAS